MAEENIPSAEEAPTATGLTRSARRAVTPKNRSLKRVTRVLAQAVPRRNAAIRVRPVRTVVTLTMVAGLFATVAIPAYASTQQNGETQTLQQAAASDAQSLVVGSEAVSAVIERGSYSATTAEEVEKAKADRTAAASRSTSRASLANIDLSMVAPGSGAVRWPLAGGYTLGPGLGGYAGHKGQDMMAPRNAPIFAVAAGVVRNGNDCGSGYGNCVVIDHNINGQRVSTRYAHMQRTGVSTGQRVEAGQAIGLVGDTGRAFGTHLHIEVTVGGVIVDPMAWLRANAG